MLLDLTQLSMYCGLQTNNLTQDRPATTYLTCRIRERQYTLPRVERIRKSFWLCVDFTPSNGEETNRETETVTKVERDRQSVRGRQTLADTVTKRVLSVMRSVRILCLNNCRLQKMKS